MALGMHRTYGMATVGIGLFGDRQHGLCQFARGCRFVGLYCLDVRRERNRLEGQCAVHGCASAVRILSRVMGKLRMRFPVAWKMAFDTAAATPTMPISPRPFTPMGLALSSSSS